MIQKMKKKQNGPTSCSACQRVMSTLLRQAQKNLDHQKKIEVSLVLPLL